MHRLPAQVHTPRHAHGFTCRLKWAWLAPPQVPPGSPSVTLERGGFQKSGETFDTYEKQRCVGASVLVPEGGAGARLD
jgi:hypothetical protein